MKPLLGEQHKEGDMITKVYVHAQSSDSLHSFLDSADA